MAKSKKKNKKSEFDDLFNKPTEDQWLTGVSAMALDGEEPSAAPASAAASKSAGDGDVMDTSDLPARNTAGLGVKHNSMKAVRGNRTTTQKKRKAAKMEKALARAEKVKVKVAGFSSKKQKKSELKHIY